MKLFNFIEKYNEAVAYRKWYSENLMPKTVSYKTISDQFSLIKFKEKFGIWQEWTGARFVNRQNPNPTENTDLAAICRRDPVTGAWQAI